MSNKYTIPNRAVALTVVESNPINKNWEEIQKALNQNYNLASQVTQKIDASEKNVAGGVATLGIDSKLTPEQLPEQAKGHIYMVDSLSEQLQLRAFVGDVCVRSDIKKTFALQKNDATIFRNWIEIAAINSGGEIGSNPTYTNDFTKETWRQDNNKLFIAYPNLEHGQGSTKYLLVLVKNSYGENINCDYSIDEDGTVYLYTENTFNGSVIISNLQGNCDNLNFIPYSIKSGNRVNKVPSLINFTFHSLSLITSPTINLVDGLNIVRNIKECDETILSDTIADGIYTVFIDSEHINNNTLLKLTVLEESKYLGVLESLPNTGLQNQRCYIAFDKSYEHVNGAWISKAFVPVGQINIVNHLITEAITFPYNQNQVNVNYKSTNLDFLFGNSIEGLEINITSQLEVTKGKCLAQDKLITLNTNIVKNLNQPWAVGNQQGCLDTSSLTTSITVYEVSKGSEVYYTNDSGEQNTYVEDQVIIYTDVELTNIYKISAENEFIYTGNTSIIDKENEGWGNIFLIGNNYETDVMLSFNNLPTLPIFYNYYRKIGCFYKKQDAIIQCHQFKDKTYLKTPISLEATVLNTKQTKRLDVPNNSVIILNYTMLNEQQIQFYLNDCLAYSFYGKENTITLPYVENLTFKGGFSEDINFNVLGLINER